MIVGVAIKVGELVYALPRPARHPHLFAEYNDSQRRSAHDMRLRGEAVPPGWQLNWSGWYGLGDGECEQGFVNERGEFLSREDAAVHALSIGMIAEPVAQLYSETVW